MSVCPICKYHHQQEVDICQRCNWSMADSLDSLGIVYTHPIFSVCIPTLVKSLEDKTTQCEKLNSIIQNIDLQESNSRKLDEILDRVEENSEQIEQQFNQLQSIINDLKLPTASKKIEDNEQQESIVNNITEQVIKSSSDYQIGLSDPQNIEYLSIKEEEEEIIESVISEQDDISDSQDCGLYNFNSTNKNIDIAPQEYQEPEINYCISNSQEDSFHNSSPIQKSTNIATQEDQEPEVNFNSTYNSFYSLIKKGKLDIIKVLVSQENMERIRDGSLNEVEFINDNKGNYWIVDWQNTYCLIPKRNINIEEHNYGNFKKIFDCQDYRETYKDLEIIKPATVIKSDNQTWQLQVKGTIKFI